MLEDVQTLDQYLSAYGPLLGEQARKNLEPLHVPGETPPHPRIQELLRTPYGPQAAAITGGVAALRRQKSLLLIGECGTGKTLMGQAIAHCHADGRPYNAAVMCPGQLTGKWRRELEETLPGIRVKVIEHFRDLGPIWEFRQAGGYRQGRHWFVISRDTAKLGSAKKAAVWQRRRFGHGAHTPHCSTCGNEAVKKTKEGGELRPMTLEEIQKALPSCEVCGEPLWQFSGVPRGRYEPAKFIHKRMKGWLDYFILDEMHEEKGADTAQANAMGSLAASSRKVIAMTGTLIGGYAEHIRTILWRLAPRTLAAEGLDWKDSIKFSERYGRIETRITDRDSGEANKQSRGKRTTSKYVRPGIVPTLFGNHLIGNSIFLGLDEMGEDLPPLIEVPGGVVMSGAQEVLYRRLEKELKDKVSELLRKRDRRLLAAMLTTLMAWPDHPFGWTSVGYRDRDGGFVPCAWPGNLDPEELLPKEDALLELCRREAILGRQVWLYVVYNDRVPVEGRLAKILEQAGFTVGVLKSSVDPAKREGWIAREAPGVDVMISHPRLVQTGLDLFDKAGGHNFCTLAFYETGYELPVLRQASRRAWRLMQQKECRVHYLYYRGTMQERAMALMGQKLMAAEALEGKFSSEGLIALAGDDGLEIALAKSLVGNLDESADRSWGKAARAAGGKRKIKLQEVV